MGIRKVFFSIYLVTSSSFLRAQLTDCSVSLSNNISEKRLNITVLPNFIFGTHINGIGGDLFLKKSFLITKNSSLKLSARSGLKYYFRYLGIPGSSYSFEEQLDISYNFGSLYNISAYKILKQNRYSFSYYLINYESTDNTSQLSGGIKFRYLNENGENNFLLEDDFLAFLGLDEYRTFAMEINKKKFAYKNIYGIGCGLIFWTGTTKGLGFLHRNQIYDMSKQYGGGYSNGIACITLYYNNIKLYLGYDSEVIRSFFQNGFHYLIDDGKILPIKRNDRIFLELSFLDLGSLY